MIGRFLRKLFRLDRRYGVRHSGNKERTGFFTDSQAQAWLDERDLVGIVFYYDPIDLRVPGRPQLGRDSFRP